MNTIPKQIIGTLDNFIDWHIDRILNRMKTETQEEFKERWDKLSPDVKDAVRKLLQEQIKMEVKHKRLDELETLQARLESFE